MTRFDSEKRMVVGALAALALTPAMGRAQPGSNTQRLQALGIVLPQVPAPIGSYVPYTLHGNLIFAAGQIPVRNGELIASGVVPTTVSIEQAAACARQCAINLLAAAAAACGGDLDRVDACLKVSGFVASTADFKDQPAVLNGASELIGSVLGERGKHARAAVGVMSLPRGAPVEVEAIFSMR